jgi:hypothetical protein
MTMMSHGPVPDHHRLPPIYDRLIAIYRLPSVGKMEFFYAALGIYCCSLPIQIIDKNEIAGLTDVKRSTVCRHGAGIQLNGYTMVIFTG